jgi:membrane protease YdiL (CAAX protease family)
MTLWPSKVLMLEAAYILTLAAGVLELAIIIINGKRISMAANIATNTTITPNWRHVSAFLGLSFGLTWLLDLGLYLHGGLAAPDFVTIVQCQMLLPAFSAIVLGLFFFPESPIYARGSPAGRDGRGRWFYYYFLLLTVVYALSVLDLWLAPTQETRVLTGILTQLVSLVGLIVLIIVRLAAGREALARVGLAWGNWRYYLLLGLGFAAFYVVQAVLNALFGLGPTRLALIPAPPGIAPAPFLILAGVQSVLLAPILFIAIAFGEEYGWRGYLQGELMKMGRVRGTLLVGVIWGVWHWPIILMGWSYPGYPLAGLALTALFTTGLAVVLGYAVLRSGSVLLAAYLHGLNDQVTAYLVALGFKPFDPVFSFGVGIYAVITLAIVALFVFRDPVWRGKGDRLK